MDLKEEQIRRTDNLKISLVPECSSKRIYEHYQIIVMISALPALHDAQVKSSQFAISFRRMEGLPLNTQEICANFCYLLEGKLLSVHV